MKFAIRKDELRRTLEIAGETWRKVAKWVCDSELWRNSPFAMANCGESPQMANRKAKFVAKANFVANANIFPLVIYITQPLLRGGSNFSVKQYKEHVSPFASTRLVIEEMKTFFFPLGFTTSIQPPHPSRPNSVSQISITKAYVN